MIKSAIRSFISLGVFAAACLVPLSPAQTATPVVPPVTPASPTWKINCPGVPNVPMTADSEQSLPLQLVATLKCSEEVTVLDNSEGYTARIKTADGKTGYVAVMYLKKIPAPRRAPSMESANIENGAARWEQSAPGCDSFMSNSILVESLTANGITVQVSLHDTGWKLRANIAIANSAAQPVRIVPSQFILDDVGLNGKPLFYNDPAQLAKNPPTGRRAPRPSRPPQVSDTDPPSLRPSRRKTTSFRTNTPKTMPCINKANKRWLILPSKFRLSR